MALAEAITIAVGTSIAKWITKTWLGEGLPAEVAGSLTDLIGQRVPDFFSRRRLERQFDQVAEVSGEKLAALVELKFRNLPDNERLAAVDAAADSLDVGLRQTSVMALDFDPIKVLAAVRAADPDRANRAGLSPAGARLYEMILEESCNYVAEVSSTLPALPTTASIELLRRNTALIDLVNEVYRKLPDPDSHRREAKDRAADFEVSYRRFITRTLDRLELFGISVSELSNRFSLSVAYITLSVKSRSHDTVGETNERDYLRVDNAIGPESRIFVRGEAGSGKTTLLHWLAVKAARQEFTGPLEGWKGAVPFFLQLRRLDPDRLPAPSEFLRHISGSVADNAPAGWVTETLKAGRALVMIDGIDEVPASARDAVRRWLEDDLMGEYPSCRYVVTSRPAAVPEDWLGRAGFVPMDLQPMTIADIRAFVSHWHAAAARMVADADYLAELEGYEGALLRTVISNRQIRNLATSPLLCAMLCALNRDRRTHLPQDRVELYRIALETLLERRDLERKVDPKEHPPLTLPQKMILLREVAYWLMLNNQSDTERSNVRGLISRRLRNLPGIAAGGEAVTDHLLERSGLLREPFPGRVDFIHRTFQEYLAAIEIYDRNDIPFLVSKAHEDQWREVVLLVAGTCTIEQKESLLQGIIRRGDTEGDQKHRLHLLAVACLETARELPPALAERVTQCLVGLLPPQNFTDARVLASAGDLALPLLKDYTQARASVAAACIRAAGLIGGDLSTDVIAAYGKDRRRTVQKELLRAWAQSTDPVAFAKRVLATTPFATNYINIADANQFVSAAELPDTLRIYADIREYPFETVPAIPGLLTLSLDGSDRLRTVEGLARSTSLEGLTVRDCKSLTTLSGLAGLSHLVSLDVSDCKSLTSIEALRGGGLRELTANGCTAIADWDVVGTLPHLERLDVDGCRIDDIRFVSSLTKLTHVTLNGNPITSLDLLNASAGTIVDLDADGCEALTDIEALTSFRAARSIRLGSSSATRLPDLTGLSHLRVLYLDDCSRLSSIGGLPESLECLVADGSEILRIDAGIGPLPSLRVLYLDFAPTEDLSFIRSAANLAVLTLYNAEKLRDLKPLAHLRHLADLDLRGCRPGLDLRELLGRARTKPLRIYLNVDQQVDGLEEFLSEGNRIDHGSFTSTVWESSWG